MRLSARWLMWGLVGLSGGCSPTFDWRETRPSDGVVVMFPCRPKVSERAVALAGERVEMKLLSCEAGGSAFAVSRIEAADPVRGAALLQALRAAMVENLSAPPTAAASSGADLALGSTSKPGRLGGESVDVRGKGPEGGSMRARGEFFSHRGAVMQATVVGRDPDPQAVEFFFASLKLQ